MAEAAGLVLAALPVIVEGLRVYLKGIESIKKWWEYAKALKRLIRKFQVEQRKLVNTCTELLEGLVDDTKLVILLEEPGGADWQERSLQLSLRGRLGGSYQVFFDAVTEMTEVVEEFEERLELDDDYKPRWLDYNKSKREWKRVLFGLSESASEKLVEKLEHNNKDLGDLLGHSLRMESLRVSKPAGNAKYYERIQESARGLYNILKQTFTRPCGCSIPHKASLRLQRRQQNSNPGLPLEIQFNVLFSFETHHSMAGSVPWNWREAEIESSEHVHHENNPTSANAPRKRVMFAPAKVPDVAQKVKDLSLQTNKIDCLCMAMNTRVQHKQCLGVLVDEMQRQHRVTVRDRPYPDDATHTVSLKSLLNDPTRLEKRDRLVLGVKLASTLLQLDRTPWLQNTWGKRDIDFLSYGGGDSSRVLVQTPLIARHFSAPTCAFPSRQLTDRIGAPSPEVRNTSIFALGVILIELWFNRPMETLRTINDLDKDGEANQITDFATARRLIEEIYREAGEWYGDAVRRCIYCDFDHRHNDLSLSSMKEAVHQGVLAPLQENLNSFCGGKANELLA